MVDQFQLVMFRKAQEGGAGGSMTTVIGENCPDDAQRLGNVPFAGVDLSLRFNAADEMIQSLDGLVGRSFGDPE
jgi:hypothetical protein